MLWIRRTFGASALALLGMVLLTVPAKASPAPDAYYQVPTPYAFADTFDPGCDGTDFTVKVRGEGVEWTLNVPGSNGQAFLFGQTYNTREKWINNKTGKYFTWSAQGVYSEVSAVKVPRRNVPADLIPDEGLVGPIYLFTATDTVKQATTRKSNGTVVLRDRGTLTFEQLFDTLGDKQPGGFSLSYDLVKAEGHFPGLDVDYCKLGARLTK